MRNVIIAILAIWAVPAFAQNDDAMKARNTDQFTKAAQVCAQHVSSTLPDGSSVYEKGYEECRTIMHRKALMEANPNNFK